MTKAQLEELLASLGNLMQEISMEEFGVPIVVKPDLVN
jgi:hypothetical protein